MPYFIVERTYYLSHPSRRGFLKRYAISFMFLSFSIYSFFFSPPLTIPTSKNAFSLLLLVPSIILFLYGEITRRMTTYIVDERGVYRNYSFLSKTSSYIPLVTIEKTTYYQSLPERILGVGKVEVWGEENLNITFEDIKDPKKVSDMINNIGIGYGKRRERI